MSEHLLDFPYREFRCISCDKKSWQPVTDDNPIREARLSQASLRVWYCGCHALAQAKPGERR
jgi:hypothetical protein